MTQDFLHRGRHVAALRFLRPGPRDRILDVGCSSGYFQRHYLIGRVERAVGVDAQEANVRYAQERDGVEHYVQASSNALPFEDDTFDKVLCLDVLEHVDDERGTLTEIQRVLKPGGLLVLSVPNDFMNFLDLQNVPSNFPRALRLWGRARGKLPADAPGREFHRHYSGRQLVEMLRGFHVVKVHRTAPLAAFRSIAMRLLVRGPRAADRYRRWTGWLEDLDYRFDLGFGFALMIVAHAKPIEGAPQAPA